MIGYQRILKIREKTIFIKILRIRDSNKKQQEKDKDQNE